MNLQICFMNETASDCESQCSDTESTQDREIETDRVSTSSSNSKVCVDVFVLYLNSIGDSIVFLILIDHVSSFYQ